MLSGVKSGNLAGHLIVPLQPIYLPGKVRTDDQPKIKNYSIII